MNTFLHILADYIKFIYSEKATNCCEISTIDLSYVVTVKSTVEISQNFVAFSEYTNFNSTVFPYSRMKPVFRAYSSHKIMIIILRIAHATVSLK